MARTTDQPGADDPILGALAKRKAEALARAEKEHSQLAAAARLYAQGTKAVTDAEEQLRKGREKQDTAIANMIGAGLDVASVAETLDVSTKAVNEAVKRHRAATGEAEPAKRPGRPPKARTEDPAPVADSPQKEPAENGTGAPPATRIRAAAEPQAAGQESEPAGV